MTRRQSFVLRAFAAWTVYVWGTRIWNVVGDETRGTAFKVVHMMLALVSVAFAAATWAIVSANRRRPDAGQPTPKDEERGRARS